MGTAAQERRSEAGFSLVELMAASMVLVVGILSVFTLVIRTNESLNEANGRVGANNLARELTEFTRAVDYDDVTQARLPARLHVRTGVAGTANPWEIKRRGITYTVNVQVCMFDDPADGLVASTFVADPAKPLCPRAAAINTRVDTNPDDFRRLTVNMSWSASGKQESQTQTAQIVNPSGGLGPRIINFPQPAAQITSSSSTLTLGGITTTSASAVRWNSDEGNGAGDAGSTGTNAWSINWNIGSNLNATNYVVDGTYVVSAQAFNDFGVPGDVRSVSVQLNRYTPAAPQGVYAGRNSSKTPHFVDIGWTPNIERDIRGYRVYRSDGVRICPATAVTTDVTTATSCVDSNPPATAVSYRVVAVDLTDLANQNSTPREGVATTVSLTAGNGGGAPAIPTDLVASTVGGLPRITWTQPGGNTGIRFYRIYRDGETIGDRYAVTVTNEPFWNDAAPGDASVNGHVYRVSAVDMDYNESKLSDPVCWGVCP